MLYAPGATAVVTVVAGLVALVVVTVRDDRFQVLPYNCGGAGPGPLSWQLAKAISSKAVGRKYFML